MYHPSHREYPPPPPPPPPPSVVPFNTFFKNYTLVTNVCWLVAAFQVWHGNPARGEPRREPRQKFSRHSVLSRVHSDVIYRGSHGRPGICLRGRHVEQKFHPNLKVGCVFTCFYRRGHVKVLFCVLCSNSFRCIGYFGPAGFWSNFFEVYHVYPASKKGVW